MREKDGGENECEETRNGCHFCGLVKPLGGNTGNHEVALVMGISVIIVGIVQVVLEAGILASKMKGKVLLFCGNFRRIVKKDNSSTN